MASCFLERRLIDISTGTFPTELMEIVSPLAGIKHLIPAIIQLNNHQHLVKRMEESADEWIDG